MIEILGPSGIYNRMLYLSKLLIMSFHPILAMDNQGFTPPIEVTNGSEKKQEQDSRYTPEVKTIEEDESAPNISGLLYTVEEIPPVGVTFFSAIQVNEC